VRGIALGGDTGVARVEFSSDDGKTWQITMLGKDEGKYSFRQWHAEFARPSRGKHMLTVRCTNMNVDVQPETPNWNPSGFMRNVIETIPVFAV
jgi:hypothetical protein